MNPVIYGVVDPTATDPNLRMMPVSGTDNGDGTCTLDVVAGSGGATSALQTSQLTELQGINAGTPAALGQAAMAASMPVVLASNQSRILVEPLGTPSAAQKITTSGTSGNVTLAAGTTRVSIYATKAAYFNIGTGSLVAASTNFFIGDNERLDFNVTAGGKLAAIQDSAAGVVYITELV